MLSSSLVEDVSRVCKPFAGRTDMTVDYRTTPAGVDWDGLVQVLAADAFHNGRTPRQLRLSFENSAHLVIAWDEGRVVGTARALSDGVGNAYVVDVWTRTTHRRRGIGRRMMERLIDRMPGQHVYLQCDDAVNFYRALGFAEQPEGLSLVVGTYLDNDTR